MNIRIEISVVFEAEVVGTLPDDDDLRDGVRDAVSESLPYVIYDFEDLCQVFPTTHEVKVLEVKCLPTKPA